MKRIVSVNVGLPREVEWQNRTITTGIFKYPVTEALPVTFNGITGDGQADLIHHGGRDKAVYAYPFEHYAYWQEFLGKDMLEVGSFGENLTTEGLMDTEVRMGDHWQFGSAILMIVQPRMPCSKIGLRFNDASMTRHFARARRNGFYFRVIEEGTVRAGDTIRLVQRSPYDITIQEVVDCYAAPRKNPEKTQRILQIPFLPELLKSSFEHLIQNSDS